MYTPKEAENLTGIKEAMIRNYIAAGIVKEPLSDTDIAKLEDVKWLKEHDVMGEVELKFYLLNPSWRPGNPEIAFEKVRAEWKRKNDEATDSYNRIVRNIILVVLPLWVIFRFVTGGMSEGFWNLGAIAAIMAIVYGVFVVGIIRTKKKVKKLSARSQPITARVTEVKADRTYSASLVRAGGGDMPIGKVTPLWWIFLLEVICQMRTDVWYPQIRPVKNNPASMDGTGANVMDAADAKGAGTADTNGTNAKAADAGTADTNGTNAKAADADAADVSLCVSGWKYTWERGENIEVLSDSKDSLNFYPADPGFYSKKLVIDLLKMIAAAAAAVFLLISSYYIV